MPVDRSVGIGGSDIGGILGISPWKTAWQVYQEKVGEIEAPKPTEEMEIGSALERAIAETYARRTNRAYGWDNVRKQSSEYPFVLWTPDAHILSDKRWRILDCKNVGPGQAARWGEEGTDDVPREVLLQMLWYLIAEPESEAAEVAALICGNRLRGYTIHRTPEAKDVQVFMLEAAEKFMREYVTPRIPPPIDGSDYAANYLKQKYPRHTENVRRVSEAEGWLIRDYAGARRKAKEAEETKAALGNALREAIADFEGIDMADGSRATWKKTRDGKVTDWERMAMEIAPGFCLIRDNPLEVAAFRVFSNFHGDQLTPDALIEHYTKPKPGHRTLRVTYKGEDE